MIVSRVIPAIAACLLFILTACHTDPSPKAFPAASESLLTDFRIEGPLTAHAYDSLFAYFVQGFESYRIPTGSMAMFPGLPSRHGKTADGMEGFARMAPLWGVWVASGRPAVIRLPGGNTVDLNAAFKQGVLNGTNPRSPGYWGNIADLDQRIVEASDVALSLWLFRDVWQQFSPPEKRQVADWLYQVNGKRIPDNNWHLFITFINVVLDKLGCPADRALARQHYERLKLFYRGDGWFSDGPDETFDYYNAWAIHYQLYWLQQVDPEWDPEFITTVRRKFVDSYQYLVTVNGVPILGRSICYRMAAAAPLVFSEGGLNEEIPAGEARRALDVTWRYFIRNGGLRAGNITQGYCGPDARILDNYSGPASCLWGLRSLIVAYYKAPQSLFWQGPAGKLPVETRDFAFSIASTKWHVIGEKSSGTVEIDMPVATESAISLQPYGWTRRLASTFLWRPFRPDNTEAKYRSPRYDSAHPFCGCAR